MLRKTHLPCRYKAKSYGASLSTQSRCERQPGECVAPCHPRGRFTALHTIGTVADPYSAAGERTELCALDDVAFSAKNVNSSDDGGLGGRAICRPMAKSIVFADQ
jgi:hypothetical protein